MLSCYHSSKVKYKDVYKRQAWEYQAKSEIRDTISAVYEELFQEEPVFEAIHAGLECGILSGKIKELDCVSFGPNNYDIHTPKERLSISSTEKVWKLLVAFLKKCKMCIRDRLLIFDIFQNLADGIDCHLRSGVALAQQINGIFVNHSCLLLGTWSEATASLFDNMSFLFWNYT